jgi:large subunit ribosomal protein L13Ae
MIVCACIVNCPKRKQSPSLFFFFVKLQFCHVGRLSHEVGWKYQTVVRTLESKRKVKAVLTIRKRDKLKKLTKEASSKVVKQVAPFTTVINSYGYN